MSAADPGAGDAFAEARRAGRAGAGGRKFGRGAGRGIGAATPIGKKEWRCPVR